MMYTLSSFYKSKEWMLFRLSVINERLIKDKCSDYYGLVICEHCGKPIIKQYDCIAHHIEELAEENVNDVEVSLNPANIKLVHHKCHNIMHDKLASGSRYSSKRVYIVYGSPLSGKSSWVRDSMGVGDLIIDMDSIWQCVSGCDRYVKPKRLSACAFGVRDYLLESVRLRRGKWQNAYVIGGYPLISERERLARELDAELIYVDTSREECMERLLSCSDGRDVTEWSKYIDDWWRKYAPRLYE